MKRFSLTISFFFILFTTFGQDDPQTAMSKLGPDPIFIINDVKVVREELFKYDADSIASVYVLLDTNAIKAFGDSAKDGAVIIETRFFAKNKAIQFFKKESKSFDSLYTKLGTDTSFQYVINDKIQTGNYEGNLTSITKELLIGIEIMPKAILMNKYKVTNKEYGIIIRSKIPKELYKANQKF